jgi:hypothetical protein
MATIDSKIILLAPSIACGDSEVLRFFGWRLGFLGRVQGILHGGI